MRQVEPINTITVLVIIRASVSNGKNRTKFLLYLKVPKKKKHRNSVMKIFFFFLFEYNIEAFERKIFTLLCNAKELVAIGYNYIT